jgi:hypothetical protein
VRETGTTILLVVVTLGIYIFIYNYSVHDEMKRHSGRGIGGGIALLLSFLAGVAMPFITPAEVANLYRMRGWAEPVNGWTGLWAVLPSSVGYALFLALSIVSAATAPKGSGIDAAYVVAFLIYIVAVITGGIVWFVKTNAALNAYWRAVSAAPAGL